MVLVAIALIVIALVLVYTQKQDGPQTNVGAEVVPDPIIVTNPKPKVPLTVTFNPAYYGQRIKEDADSFFSDASLYKKLNTIKTAGLLQIDDWWIKSKPEMSLVKTLENNKFSESKETKALKYSIAARLKNNGRK